MIPFYYVIDRLDRCALPANIRPAVQRDFIRTEQENWQTNWLSDFIQQEDLEKYALEIVQSHELIALGAYRNLSEGVLVYVEYLGSAPSSNPTLAANRKYAGIGAALLAYGVQLSIDYGYSGAIYLKAKTSDIREHYIKSFGATPFSRADPYLLLIDGDASKELFSQFLKEE